MNISEQQHWRVSQLAASDIKKYLPNAILEQNSSPYWDFIVRIDDYETIFGVNIVRTDYARSKSYTDYLEMLRQHEAEQELPIALICVNEAKEEIKTGILLSWQYRRPSIDSNVTLKSSSKERWNYLVDVIRPTASEHYKVGVLHSENCYIKKTIDLNVTDRNGRLYIGELVYLRKLSEEYRMNSPVERTPEEQFTILLNGIPRDEYPSDSLDDAIFEAIHQEFDVEPTRNEMLILTTELRDALRYRDYLRGEVNVSISPIIIDIRDVAIQLMGQFSVFSVGIDLFAYNNENLQYFNERAFDYNEPVEGWMEKAMTLRSKIDTYKKLSELF